MSCSFQGECLVRAEFGAAVTTFGLCSKASLLFDHAHDPVLEQQAALYRVRFTRVHAQATTHAFFLVDLGTKFLYIYLRHA